MVKKLRIIKQATPLLQAALLWLVKGIPKRKIEALKTRRGNGKVSPTQPLFMTLEAFQENRDNGWSLDPKAYRR